MGRLGPLTSQGLGRSPYDDVVQGEGEPDPRAPPQQYDERGRPANPLTRQINRDIIRSHNEVMQVIGVAEPENLTSEPKKLTEGHRAWEENVGMRLFAVGRFASTSGVWGVLGMRRRILLYQPYSHVPLLELWGYERRQRLLTAILFSGYPAFAALAAIMYSKLHLGIFYRIYGNPYSRTIYDALEAWIRIHVNVFTIMQQLDILPARSFLPGPMFFIPCSSSSPIPAPPPLASLTTSEVVRWVGSLALNAAPIFGVYASQRVFTKIRENLRRYFRRRLPTPTGPSCTAGAHDVRTARNPGEHPPAPHRVHSTTQPQSPTRATEPTPASSTERNAGGFPTTSQMRPRDEPRDEPEPTALEQPEEGAPAPNDPVPPGHVRRQSTISTRGITDPFLGIDAYCSDDEDDGDDMVSTTLISFDVEATDATDPPPGQWSAELRPNVAEGSRSDGVAHAGPARQPNYRSTALTRLPSMLAADIFAWLAMDVLWAPVEAVTCRWFARSFAGARGLSVAGLYPVWALGLSRHMIANFIGVELVQFFIQFDVWVGLYALASNFVLTEEQWNYIDGPGAEWIAD